MARGDRWWNEPPLWAWATMVTGLVAIVVLLPVALSRTVPSSTVSGTAAGTDAGEPSTAPSASAGPTGTSRVVVIGDSDAGGAGPNATAWPALLDERLADIEIEALTTGGSGYVSTAAGESTLTDLATGADLSDADLVVLFGSRFDASGISDQVSAAAEDALTTVRDEAPDAAVLVIGPLWPGGAPPAGVRNNRDVIRAAADAAAVPFVDPLNERWLTGGTGLVGGDDVHLTDRGQAALADLVQPLVEGALDEADRTTAGG
jgi:lysophospholipase L1-like esterase